MKRKYLLYAILVIVIVFAALAIAAPGFALHGVQEIVNFVVPTEVTPTAIVVPTMEATDVPTELAITDEPTEAPVVTAVPTRPAVQETREPRIHITQEAIVEEPVYIPTQEPTNNDDASDNAEPTEEPVITAVPTQDEIPEVLPTADPATTPEPTLQVSDPYVETPLPTQPPVGP